MASILKFGRPDERDAEPPPGGWGRRLWLYTEESGTPRRVGRLVRKFRETFSP
jgi:hypothetical protein